MTSSAHGWKRRARRRSKRCFSGWCPIRESVLKGLGEPSEAGIHTLHQADDLTILNVVWAPLMVLLPHNHNMWASIGIYTGREDNIIWRRSDGVIEASRAAALSEREVFGLASDAIHSVTNPVERLTGAIHIYGGDFFKSGRSEWDPETLRERPFDLEGARRFSARRTSGSRRFAKACSTPGQLRACSSEAFSATASAACPLTRSFHASS